MAWRSHGIEISVRGANTFRHESVFSNYPGKILKGDKNVQIVYSPKRRSNWALKFMRIIYLIHPTTSTAACERRGTMFRTAGSVTGAVTGIVWSAAPLRDDFTFDRFVVEWRIGATT